MLLLLCAYFLGESDVPIQTPREAAAGPAKFDVYSTNETKGEVACEASLSFACDTHVAPETCPWSRKHAAPLRGEARAGPFRSDRSLRDFNYPHSKSGKRESVSWRRQLKQASSSGICDRKEYRCHLASGFLVDGRV